MAEVESALRCRRLVRALVAAGLREVVYCPGSRDAPLGYALASAERAGWLRLHVRLDERSAGFVALGLSRAALLGGDRVPAAVVTTSGTAVANLHPAVLEADASGVPLLVLSADRPHEMWHTGANQTTLQAGIFGAATRFAATIPAGFPADSRLDGLVNRAMVAAVDGPVQLDVCLRDPLVPDQQWQPGERPAGVDRRAASASTTAVRMPARTVVVAGDAAGPQARAAAQQCCWPLLAEPSSGARGGVNALVDYQSLLGTELAAEIEGVLVFGHPTLSRPVSRLLAREDVAITVVAESRRWTDVAGLAQVMASPVEASVEGTGDPDWLPRWTQADAAAPPTQKDRAAAVIWQSACGVDAPALVIGASAVIRSFDRFAVPADQSPTVVANRGLAGIDGTVSTAIGLSVGLGRPVRVVVGDLTAAHDATALLTGSCEADADVQVIVLNDAGGAIFAGLEHAAAPRDVLERFFLTPQRMDFEALAAALGAGFQRVGVAGLGAVLEPAVTGRSIVEVTLAAL